MKKKLELYDKKKKVIFYIVLSLSIILIGTGIMVMKGIFDESKVHLSLHEFEWDGKPTYLQIRFQSEGSTFTTGETVHATAVLGAEVSSKTKEFFVLHFPETWKPEDYNKLQLDKNWDVEVTETSIEISFPSKIYYNLKDFPPNANFDLIWTKEGLQKGVLLIGENPFEPDQEIILENVINIRPSEVRLQLNSNNYSLGLALIVISLTMITSFFGFQAFAIPSKIKEQKLDSIKKSSISQTKENKKSQSASAPIAIVDNFENDIIEYSFRRVQSEVTEVQRIKDRATALFGFCIVILTGFSAVAIFYLNNGSLDQLYPYLLAGFVFIVGTMIALYYVMIADARRFFLEPELFYKIYQNQDYNITKGVLRETLFYAINEMSDRNDKLVKVIRISYFFFPVGPAVIFIPFLSMLYS